MQETLTTQDLEALVEAGRALKEREDLAFSYSRSAGIHLRTTAFAQLLAMTKADPAFEVRDSEVFRWEVSTTVKGVRFYALFRTAELPMIGYHVPGWVEPSPTPVPIPEPAQTA